MIARLIALLVVFASGVLWANHYYGDPVTMKLCLASKADLARARYFEFRLSRQTRAEQVFPVPELNGTIGFTPDPANVSENAFKTSLKGELAIAPGKAPPLCE